jgi:hypothetical protein
VARDGSEAGHERSGSAASVSGCRGRDPIAIGRSRALGLAGQRQSPCSWNPAQ